MTEIKVRKTVQINLSPEPLVHQWIFVGLFHSHPDYAKCPILNPELVTKTPFTIHHPTAQNRVVTIAQHDIPIYGVLVLLQNENSINLDFNLISTDKANFGQKKEGKEWHQLIIPLTNQRVDDLVSSLNSLN